MSVVLFHNPRCSKSRQTLDLLEENGIIPTIRDYIKQPLSYDELAMLHRALNVDVLHMMRTKEPAFKEAGLSENSTDDALLHAMVQHPILLERPVVLNAEKAAIGRPPENVLSVLKL